MTANPERGETEVEIGGRTYVLASTFNSLIALQQRYAKDGVRPSIGEILRRANAGDLEVFRAVFWSVLHRHHADVTIEQAGDLIDRIGGIDVLDTIILRAYGASGPDPDDVTALGGAAANPRPATAKPKRRRTGARST